MNRWTLPGWKAVLRQVLQPSFGLGRCRPQQSQKKPSTQTRTISGEAFIRWPE
jgi:hypothetical protein